MKATLPPVQAIRPVHRNDRNTRTTTDDVFHVDINTEPGTQNQFVLWGDIKLAFEDALHVRHQSRVVPFLKGDDLHPLKPYRIAAFPDVILDIVVSGQITQVEVAQPPSMLRQIEHQATRYPKYNPFETLARRPSTLTPRSNIASQFPPRNDRLPGPALPRTQSADTYFRQNPRALALKAVQETMKKLVAHIDLKELHEKGDGSPKDFLKALECYLKAVRQSHACAQISVGDLFFQGQGVQQDSSLAMGWYLLAAFQGDTNAQRKIETLRL
ncbi:hypothetical protein BGX29_008566, partial [Mortierella sp. GBA35]